MNFALWIVDFCERNEGSTGAIQLDSQNRFMHAFLCPGQSVHLVEKGILQKFLGYDGGHSKILWWDGVYRFWVGKTGFGTLFPLCISAGPVEDTNNCVWDLCMAEKAGIPLEDCKMPMDRGHMLSAGAVAAEKLDLFVNGQFCDLHIVRNFLDDLDITRKGPLSELVRALTLNYCHSDTLENAAYNLRRIPDRLENSESPGMGLRLQFRLAEIDPIHIVHAANVPSWDDNAFFVHRISAVAEYLQFVATEETRRVSSIFAIPFCTESLC